MPEPQRPLNIPAAWAPVPDHLTPQRDITHAHFNPGEQVVILQGVAGAELWGASMRVVTPSWHTPTDENGWRLRDPEGGERSYVTAHPRYLVHLNRRCPDCLIHLRAMEDHLLPRFTGNTGVVNCRWYEITALNHMIHIGDGRQSR